jgi:glycosyltransferase involved in cell wall biosynthesis
MFSPSYSSQLPRVAYFPDSFHEVNGVAHTSRHFEAFARRWNLPFLCVRAGNRSPALRREGNVWTLELPRGALSFALEKDLSFDPAYARHIPVIAEALDEFAPTLIHITGPSELGMLGAAVAAQYGLPLAASWHTNVHEYLARRSEWLFRLLPGEQPRTAGRLIEGWSLAAAARFYARAQVLFAPSQALCEQLTGLTGRPCHRMPRGVDTSLFTPARRMRQASVFTLGFVGRLSVEKNVALLAAIHDQLHASGLREIRFVVVGQGGEEAMLRERMPESEFAGVLRGETLAAAYAGMDLFVFPSHTDTFGNVVLEALASGVPTVVTPDGGPATILRDAARVVGGPVGCIAPDEEFAAVIEALVEDPPRLSTMGVNARRFALTATWDAVFEGVYRGYGDALGAGGGRSREAMPVCDGVERLPAFSRRLPPVETHTA